MFRFPSNPPLPTAPKGKSMKITVHDRLVKCPKQGDVAFTTTSDQDGD